MEHPVFAPRDLDLPRIRTTFSNASPIRHVVIDDFFSADAARALHRSFPAFSKVEELKARLFSGRVYGPPPVTTNSAFSAAFRTLASREYSRVVSAISGIEPLAMDETHDGAGAHIGLAGSSLPTHADHNTHPQASWLYRRLNLLVYLNPNWDPTWRANLILFDRTGSKKMVEIEPRYNRAVLMEVHDHAFHGYEPLRLPAGQSRQMMASYFYALEASPDQTADAHPTILAVPDDTSPARRLATSVRRRLVRYVRPLAIKPTWHSGAELPPD